MAAATATLCDSVAVAPGRRTNFESPGSGSATETARRTKENQLLLLRSHHKPARCRTARFALMMLCAVSSLLLLLFVPRAVVADLSVSGNDVFYFEMNENTPAGTYVGRIITKKGFTYRLSQELAEFVLEPHTGVLTTGRVPTDREGRDVYNLVVLSSSPTYPLEVTIRILDENDNAPYWSQFINRNVSFSESAPVGTKLIIDTATDMDDDELAYQIVTHGSDKSDLRASPSGATDETVAAAAATAVVAGSSSPGYLPFRLTYNESSSFLQLEVTDRLDREAESLYYVNISATDRVGHSGFLGLTVRILDVNDNPPIFDHSDYSVSLNESVGKGVSIIQVRATDADEEGNQNSEINYYLLSSDFEVDSSSGIISTRQDGPINCGTSVPGDTVYKKVCVFTVFAHDLGSPRQNGRAYVTVNLVDANDHDPQIKFRFFSLSEHATVDENAVNGSVVAAVSVVDLDHGLNGQTSLAIVDGNQFGHFRLESTGSSHIIRVNSGLHRDRLPKYNLTISARDQGTPPRSATAYLAIFVTDVNNQEPIFGKEIYETHISKSAPVGAFVASISAVDLDEGINSDLYYSLSGPSAHFFKIDTLTGLVTTDKLLSSREMMSTAAAPTVDSFELRVTARDGGSNPKWAHAVLKIKLLEGHDGGDRAPGLVSFDPPIPFDAVKKTFTYSLTDPGAQLTLRLDPQHHHRHEKSGETPDASASDHHHEHQPHSEYGPGDSSDSATSSASSSSVQLELLYDFNGLFQVRPTSPETWVLEAASKVDYKKHSNYMLPVMVRYAADRRSARLSEEGIIYINVIDANNRPVFEMKQYNISLTENRVYRAGEAFGRVHATDADSSDVVSYAVADSALRELFAVAPDTGTLSTARDTAFDRELKSFYEFVVLSSDSKHTDETLVRVQILDVNDCTPQFISINGKPIIGTGGSASGTASVVELALPLAKVKQLRDENFLFGVRVSDCDDFETPNARVHFHLDDSTRRQVTGFEVDTASGVVRSGRPSSLKEATYSIEMTVEDKAPGSPLRSSLAVQLRLVDSDNFVAKALLKSPAPSLHVSELVRLDEVIYEFEALDKQHAELLQVAIVGGDVHGNFRVEQNQLRINKRLDYEKVRSYQIYLEATRTAAPHVQENLNSHNSIVEFEMLKLDIQVRNENDNVPVFGAEQYNASILEEVDEPVMVMQLRASDADLSDHENEGGILKYTILEPRAGLPFRMDSRYGTLWTTGRVDREKDSEFNLLVSVEDEAGSSSTCRVLVTVLDKNDNPPRFTRLFSANISENAAPGAFVVQVTSNDKDLAAFAEATYSFIGPSEAFEIEPRTGRISLSTTVDRELKEEYLLMVAANDSSWRAQTTLTINVLDENDNSPRFDKPVYEFKRSATSQDAIVGQVRATDIDKGLNALVEYSLKHSSQYFYVNPQTGEILVKPFALSKLVYNSDQTYLNQHVLTVVGADKGTPPLSSETTVVIAVLPEDDLATYLMKEVRIPVPVDLTNGTVIFNLRSEMSLLFEEGDRSLLHVMGTKVVFLGEGLVQSGEQYNYKFISTKDEFGIALLIVSPNTFAPKFAQPRSQIMVAENKQTTEPLIHLMATDDDQDTFNRDLAYTYKVVEWKLNDRAFDYYGDLLGKDWKKQHQQGFGSTSSSKKTRTQELLGVLNNTLDKKIIDPFRIDRERGNLYLTSQLDYELIVMYRLEVTARDNAWFNPMNSTVLVTVLVSDTNDNSPVFKNLKELQKGMEVFENNLIGHIVGEVHAVDFDSPPNSQITFEIEPVYDFQNFSISAKTGQIQALISFDYERQSDYSLKVSAKNDNEMKRSVLVKVKVKDITEFDGRFAADPMSVGVIVVVLFFIVLVLVLVSSFILFRSQKKKDIRGPSLNNNHRKISTLPLTVPVKHYHPPPGPLNGPSPASTLMHMQHQGPLKSDHQTNSLGSHGHGHHHQQQSQSQQHGLPQGNRGSSPAGMHHSVQHSLKQQQQQQQQQQQAPSRPSMQPDVVDPGSPGLAPPPTAVQRAPPAPPSSFSMMSPCSDNYSEILVAAEHYDLENASSIAPSDIDLVYHYKGYRESSGPLQHRHVPLARLSPSVSELTAPRILTLHDLSPTSGPPCPPNGMGQPPPPLQNGHHKMMGQSRGPPPQGPGMMHHQGDSSDDDDGAGTVDSFTSSEFDETYKLNSKDKTMMFQRVW